MRNSVTTFPPENGCRRSSTTNRISGGSTAEMNRFSPTSVKVALHHEPLTSAAVEETIVEETVVAETVVEGRTAEERTVEKNFQ